MVSGFLVGEIMKHSNYADQRNVRNNFGTIHQTMSDELEFPSVLWLAISQTLSAKYEERRLDIRDRTVAWIQDFFQKNRVLTLQLTETKVR